MHRHSKGMGKMVSVSYLPEPCYCPVMSLKNRVRMGAWETSVCNPFRVFSPGVRTLNSAINHMTKVLVDPHMLYTITIHVMLHHSNTVIT